MSKTIALTEGAVCEVHDLLSGRESGLQEVLVESKELLSRGSVTWSIPVTPRTVHSIVTVCLFAAEHGVSVELQSPVGLSSQQAIFHDDFLLRGLPRKESLLRSLRFAAKENLALFRDGLTILRNFRSLSGRSDVDAPGDLDKALLIGQYGGEHVGDAAILGGVLFRLHRDFNTTKAYLLSHRPEHTIRLVNGLQTPVDVEVHSSTNRQIEVLLDQSSSLVFAGGPVMDLPRVLAKQLAVACSAHRRNLPIIIDRVGVGPFKRQASRYVARKIVQLATSLSVRTKAAATDPIVSDLNPQVVQDPAFEYLATRQELNRLNSDDTESVSKLTSDTKDRMRIGINLRPIRHLWSPQGESFSSRAAETFVERFAEALVNFSDRSSIPVTYVFFSMNPQEFGMSDLRIAYELHRKVGEKVDFRVWEGDPDVDGILHLLRQMDCAITMRFHACIFALTQNIPTLGIDYYPGLGGKVEQLFSDAQCVENASRMDLFDGDWLLDSLQRLEPQIKNRMKMRS